MRIILAILKGIAGDVSDVASKAKANKESGRSKGDFGAVSRALGLGRLVWVFLGLVVVAIFLGFYIHKENQAAKAKLDKYIDEKIDYERSTVPVRVVPRPRF